MEEINIDLPDDPNENVLLEMSEDFKIRINDKNKIINELKKSMIYCYGLSRALEELEDITFVSLLIEHLDKMLIEYCNLECPI